MLLRLEKIFRLKDALLFVAFFLLLGCSTCQAKGTFDQLESAVAAQDLARIEELLRSGVNPNSSTKSGGHLLTLAMQVGNIEIVALLLRYGVDPNGNQHQRAPLLVAAQLGLIEIVSLLLSQEKIELLAVDEWGNSAVHLATRAASTPPPPEAFFPLNESTGVATADVTAMQNDLMERSHKTLKLLISRGININHQNSFGQTAVMIAAKQGDFAVLKSLLDSGQVADLTLKTNGGRTALSFAIERCDKRMIEYLMAHGAIAEPIPEKCTTAPLP